ncbi:MAG: PQ-loop domain-containing transporter [Planctomycetota bacterium]
MTDLIGYLAGIALTLSFLPQVVKTYRSRRADDVSMGMLLLTLVSAMGYEVYAWRLGLIPVVVMNAIFGTLVALEIAMKFRFDRAHLGT